MCNLTHAQFGVTISQVSPNGEIGQYFKKAPAVSVYTMFDEDNWRGRAGIFYARLSPRIDSAPVYMVKEDGGTTTIIPGYLVNHNMGMGYIFIDYSYRVVKVKPVGLYLGAGMMAGMARVAYDREFEAVLTESVNRNMFIGGFKVFSMLNYKINHHFDVFGEAGCNLTLNTKYTSLLHYTFGVGFAYTIKAEK
jgi:hypothetical protein